MKKLSILLVDDQKLFVQSIKIVIDTSDLPVQQVITAGNGAEAMDYLRKNPVDIILLDIHMPEMDGIQTLKEMKKIETNAKVIILSTFGYDEYVKEAIELGVRAYLLKDCSPDTMVNTIRQVMNRNLIISEDIVKLLATPRNRLHVEAPAEKLDRLRYLSEKERKILYYISMGDNNDEIAGKLNMANQTVRNYVSTVYKKIGVDNRFKAMKMAIEVNIKDYIIEI